MVSTENGFEYLMKNNWIEKNIEEWYQTKNDEYTKEVENSIKDALFMNKKKNENLTISNIV
jgi:hypothetical protein